MIGADSIACTEMDVARRLVGGSRLKLSLVGGGRNSRVYRVETPDDVFALKRYPAVEDGRCDCLGVETGALAWMAHHGLDVVPRVVAVDAAENCVLLSWVEGAPVRTIGATDIDQAMEFLGAIEKLRRIAPLCAISEGGVPVRCGDRTPDQSPAIRSLGAGSRAGVADIPTGRFRTRF